MEEESVEYCKGEHKWEEVSRTNRMGTEIVFHQCAECGIFKMEVKKDD